jgi:feruloyl esterase
MARYSVHGDVKNADNWSCPADDTRLPQIGEAGQQAGVVAAETVRA